MTEQSKKALPKGSGYRGTDFVSYFLYSPVTKKPEYEIRIRTDMQSIEEYQKMLQQRKIEYRKIGLPVFPPPVFHLVADSSIKEALQALQAWLATHKSKTLDVSILMPDGESNTIENESDVEYLLSAII
jgi:hypothetical protein